MLPERFSRFIKRLPVADYLKGKMTVLGAKEFDSLSPIQKMKLITGTDAEAWELLTHLQNEGDFPKGEAALELIQSYRSHYRNYPDLYPPIPHERDDYI